VKSQQTLLFMVHEETILLNAKQNLFKNGIIIAVYSPMNPLEPEIKHQELIEALTRNSYVTIIAHMIFFLLLLNSSLVYAQQDWLIVNGENYSFKLPERPIISQESYEKYVAVSNFASRKSIHLSPQVTEKTCPKSTKILKKIYDQIIDKNNLHSFMMNGPNIKFRIRCQDDKYDFNMNKFSGPHVDVTNNLIIPASVVYALKSEDEIGFIIAHEVAHIIMGHMEIHFNEHLAYLNDNPLKISQEDQFKQKHMHEFEADLYGAILMWNAGYNPFSAYVSLKNISQFYFGKVHHFLATTFFKNIEAKEEFMLHNGIKD